VPLIPKPEDLTADERRLIDAMPEGWHARNLTVEYDLLPRIGYPNPSYTVLFFSGAEAGTAPRYYVGGEGRVIAYRRVEVAASGASVDDLIAVARQLGSLAPLMSLPWPIEWRVDGSELRA
jgi:hypothetical protein